MVAKIQYSAMSHFTTNELTRAVSSNIGYNSKTSHNCKNASNSCIAYTNIAALKKKPE